VDSIMTSGVLVLLIFLAVVLTVVGAYSIVSDLVLRDRSRVSKRVDEELRKRQRARVQRSGLFKNLAPVAPDVAPEDEDRPSMRQRLEGLIEQSGLDFTLQRLLGIMACSGVGVMLGLVVLRQSILAALMAGAFAALLPLLYVQRRRKARLNKLLSQLPDAFDLMARVIRAGQTMSQAMQGVADEFDAPIASEFSYCYEQQNLGLSPEIALRDLARRTGVLEIKIFVLAMVVQQQTGGNLAELLDKLAGVVRERFRIRGRIRALTAEGRMQAAVLLGLPGVLLLVMLLLNRKYTAVLLDYPGLLLGIVISEVIGSLWIRKIVNFDF
jgi:tight adherence protein B